MIKFSNSRTYIVIKNIRELENAKKCDLCMHIILESGNIIHMWDFIKFKWVKSKYTAFEEEKYKDDSVTGFSAYLRFYKYCGKSEIEKMKKILPIIEPWESFEQMHFYNLDFIGVSLNQEIFEFDVNSSFAYGATKLPKGFELLSNYMTELYEKRKNTTNIKEKTRIKKLIVYLVGYFNRIKEFVAVRSAIINESNSNVRKHIAKIRSNKGIVFLSNTDSIVTDKKGAEIMLPLVSDKLGCFKLSKYSDRLFYRSSNAYQIGDKVVYSGLSYFSRKHTNLFKGYDAVTTGNLIETYDFELNEITENCMYQRLCRVRNGILTVTVYNVLGEVIDIINYKLED